MACIAEGVAPSPVEPAPAGAEAFPPPALWVTWRGLKPFRAEVERLNADDAATGRVN